MLLLGEIDLSVGYVSGVAGVTRSRCCCSPTATSCRRPSRSSCALGAGLAIGTFHGLLITKIGIPSFVVTLAGLLAWNGVVLLLIGSRGTVILQNDFAIGLANDFLTDDVGWLLVIVCTALYRRVQFARERSRRRRACPRADPAAAHRVVGLFARRWRSSPAVVSTRTAASRGCS